MKTNKGDTQFGLIILLFLVGLFIIWLFAGGPDKSESDKPFINPYNNSNAPLKVYGPDEAH